MPLPTDCGSEALKCNGSRDARSRRAHGHDTHQSVTEGSEREACGDRDESGGVSQPILKALRPVASLCTDALLSQSNLTLVIGSRRRSALRTDSDRVV